MKEISILKITVSIIFKNGISETIISTRNLPFLLICQLSNISRASIFLGIIQYFFWQYFAIISVVGTLIQIVDNSIQFSFMFSFFDGKCSFHMRTFVFLKIVTS